MASVNESELVEDCFELWGCSGCTKDIVLNLNNSAVISIRPMVNTITFIHVEHNCIYAPSRCIGELNTCFPAKYCDKRYIELPFEFVSRM